MSDPQFVVGHGRGVVGPIGCALLHLTPTWDIRDHFVLECLCGAALDASGMIVHNAFDGRERHEQEGAARH